MVYQFKYDSPQGRFNDDVSTDGKSLTENGKLMKIFSERVPSSIKWKDCGVDYVAACTDASKEVNKAESHITGGGAQRVLISASLKTAPMFVMGVNHEECKKDWE